MTLTLNSDRSNVHISTSKYQGNTQSYSFFIPTYYKTSSWDFPPIVWLWLLSFFLIRSLTFRQYRLYLMLRRKLLSGYQFMCKTTYHAVNLSLQGSCKDAIHTIWKMCFVKGTKCPQVTQPFLGPFYPRLNCILEGQVNMKHLIF